MDPALVPTLLKLALPLAATTVIVVVARRRGLTGSDAFGLVRPAPRAFLLWLLIWAVWVVASEVAMRLMKIEAPPLWTGYSPLIIAIRILAIGVAGPIVEELAFRGVLLWRLRPRLGVPGAVLATAVIWALIHVQYSPIVMTQVALDGLLLGAARQKTGSLLPPMAMHISGNLFSIAQSLGLF